MKNPLTLIHQNNLVFGSYKRDEEICGWCPRGDSNSHSQKPTDFESAASTNSATGALCL